MYDWDEYVRKAKELLSEKSKLLALLAEAFLKAGSCKEALRNSWDNLMALLRLVKAWAKGEYRQIPWFSIVFAVAAILYFVNPFWNYQRLSSIIFSVNSLYFKSAFICVPSVLICVLFPF